MSSRNHFQRIIARTLDFQSRSLFKNSAWVFIANFFGAALAFVKAILIARILGAELYGIFTVILVFVVTVQEIFNLNLGAALIRFGSAYISEQSKPKTIALIKASMLASSVVFTGSVLTITLFTLFSYDTFIKKPGLEWFSILYAFAAGAVFFNQISRSTLRLYFKFKKNSTIQMVMDVIDFTIIALSLLLFPGELEVFLIAILVTTFINGFFPTLAAWKELKPEFPGFRNAPMKLIRQDVKPIRTFVIQNSIAKTLQSLVNKGDILLLGLLVVSPVQVAFYAIAKKLAYYILILTDPLVTSVYPQFCKLREENKSIEIINMIKRLSLMAIIPGAIFLAVVMIAGPILVTLFFGAEYSDAGNTFRILAIPALLQAVFFWMQPILQAFDLMNQRLFVFASGILSGLTAAWIIVPLKGSEGMAYAVMISQTIMYSLFLLLLISGLKRTSRSG